MTTCRTSMPTSICPRKTSPSSRADPPDSGGRHRHCLVMRDRRDEDAVAPRFLGRVELLIGDAEELAERQPPVEHRATDAHRQLGLLPIGLKSAIRDALPNAFCN